MNRKGDAPGMVASPKKQQPCTALGDRSNAYLSLFIIISAGGQVVELTFILYAQPEVYIENQLDITQVKCVRSKKGYLDRECFKRS